MSTMSKVSREQGTRAERRRNQAARAVVVAGDTLWGIARRELGDTAGTRAIDRRWRRWYQTNREVIGLDPDLILPGQNLTRPTGGSS